MRDVLLKVYRRLFKIIFYSDLHGTRIILATAELLWAITLLWPGDTFGRPTYTVMAQFMPEEAWGILFALSSMVQFYIVVQCCYHTTAATMFAAWNSMIWSYVVIAMYMSVSPPPAAISGEAALAIAAGWVWVRSGLGIRGTRVGEHE